MKVIPALIGSLTFLSKNAESLTQNNRKNVPSTSTNHHTNIEFRYKRSLHSSEQASEDWNIGQCPPPSDDPVLDRREALFASIGSLWSVGVLGWMGTFLFRQEPAHAEYGTDANIALPNVMGGISDRMNKQCIVESLGNRECLVYLDPSASVYQGVDGELLLKRVAQSAEALERIPELAKDKKWSQITGVLTGPMGTLVLTMNQISKDRPPEVARAAKEVKKWILEIGVAADRKNGERVLESYELAVEALGKFVAML